MKCVVASTFLGSMGGVSTDHLLFAPLLKCDYKITRDKNLVN